MWPTSTPTSKRSSRPETAPARRAAPAATAVPVLLGIAILAVALLPVAGCGSPSPGAGAADSTTPKPARRAAVEASGGTCDDGENSLFEAAERGDPRTVLACLAAGVDVDALDGEGRTALALAAASGSVPILKALLEAGASVDPAGASVLPLELAVVNAKLDAAELLLEAGAPLRGARGTPLLEAAALLDSNKIALALIEHGADASQLSGEPLYAAAARCDDRLVSALLGAGVDPDRRNGRGERPIDRATGGGARCTAVRDLLELHTLDPRGTTDPGTPETRQEPPWRPSPPPQMPTSPRRPPRP